MEAMETMIDKVKNDRVSIKKIKEKQLIGFEIDRVLFALACSNMFLHGDGRTNLIYGNSLLDVEKKQDKDLFNYIKRLKPTKVIINSPYENKQSIKFTIQAIEYLENNGTLVIIMPTPTLRKNQNGLTEILLKKARLDFVIKMPNNLFSEQNRTVNTSIFGFTKTPHCENDEVIFYNLSDDGFISVQHKGRIDKDNEWGKREKNIVECIKNKKEIKNISEKCKIFKNGIINCQGIKKHKNGNYEMVKLSDLFKFEKGTLASEKAVEGDYTFYSASEECKTNIDYNQDCEAIVFAIGAAGSLGRTHYANGKFIASNLCYVLKDAKNSKYPLNLKFYNYYFQSIRKHLIEDLADGTSKLTIGISDLKKYYIDYIPKKVQDNFAKQNVTKYLLAEKKFEKAKKGLKDALLEL